MNYYDLLTYRRSTRKFLDQPLSDEIIQQLLLAANAAPVGSNLYKDIHITVLTDKDAMAKYGEAGCVRVREMKKIAEVVKDMTADTGIHKDFDPYYGAPAVIIVSHRKQTLQPGIEYCNVASIVQTMHLAATELGLGSVYMWGLFESIQMYPEYDHTDVLHLPEDFEPLLGLAVGYPATELTSRDIKTDKIDVTYI